MTSGMDERTLKECEEIESIKELYDFSINHGWEHDYYFHYTTLENYFNIINGKELWLSNMENMKDKIEIDYARNERIINNNSYYLFCFSTPVNKIASLPMWYLYNGGHGICMKICKSMLKSFVNDCEVYIKSTVTDKKILLKKDKDYDLELHTMIYYKNFLQKPSTRVQISYDDWSKIVNIDDSESIDFLENKTIFKDYCWRFENETRVIVKIKQIDGIHGIESVKDSIVVLKNDSFDFSQITPIIGPEIVNIKNYLVDGERFVLNSFEDKIVKPYL